MNNEKNKNLEYSIGVVTYVARLETFFIPLIKQLVKIFPDKEIVCVINGHHDELLQIKYLKKVTAFLNQFPNVHYITNEKHQPLAKCFNWIAMMSFAPRFLIINDDISLNLLFRKEFEKALAIDNSFFIINHSWSHFLISKDFIKEIGWFEERLLGAGQEDGDYQMRMWAKNKEITEFVCHGVINYIAPQENAGWAKISEMVKGGKAAAVNDDFMHKKYSFEKDEIKGELRAGMETPVFYDFASLDDGASLASLGINYENKKPSWSAVLMLPFNVIYSYSRKTAGKIYRYIMGIA